MPVQPDHAAAAIAAAEACQESYDALLLAFADYEAASRTLCERIMSALRASPS